MADMPTAASFLDVERIVGSLGIAPGQRVADLGCGSGFFVVALARAVSSRGVVIAVDVVQEALQSAQAKAEAAGFKNVQPVRADLEVLGGTKIPDNSQDLALMKNVLFQSQKKDAIIREAARIIKPGGRLVVIDWKKGSAGLGPPDDLRVDEADVLQMATAAGLRLSNQLAADAFHFGTVFTK